MSAITWSGVTFSGTPDDDDLRAARYLVRIENAKRAAAEPPGTPLATSPAPQLKASVITILSATVDSAWDSYIEQAARDEDGITADDKRAILANIRKRLDAGEDISAIISDTAA